MLLMMMEQLKQASANTVGHCQVDKLSESTISWHWNPQVQNWDSWGWGNTGGVSYV